MSETQAPQAEAAMTESPQGGGRIANAGDGISAARAPATTETSGATAPQAPANEAPASAAASARPASLLNSGQTPAQTPAQADPLDAAIADWSKVKLEGLPDNAPLDVIASFGKEVAQELGMSQRQAEAAIRWELKKHDEFQKQFFETNNAELDRLWGQNRQLNLSRVNKLVASVCSQKGLEGFEDALYQTGAANSAVILNGLLAIANLVGEDKTGAGGASGASVQPQTAYEGIMEAYKQARSQLGNQ